MAEGDRTIHMLMGRRPDVMIGFMPHGDDSIPFPTHYDPCPTCSYRLQNEVLKEENERLNRKLEEIREVVQGGSTESE